MERNIRLNWSEFVNEAIKRRKQQKLTQKQLAILVGVSGPTINSFEQGKTSIALDNCFKILRFLGLFAETPSLFESAFDKKINPYFLNLKSSGNFVEPIEDAFRLCQAYLDKDFKKLFPLEKDFFPRLWELFVCNTLVQSQAAGHLQPNKGKGPDFFLKDFCEGKHLYIECVCPQDADFHKSRNVIENKSARYEEIKKSFGNLEGFSSRSEGFDESVVARYGSSIHDKSEKFKQSYQYTEGHYRVLCVSGCVLSLAKGKKQAAFADSVSTKEDFETVIRGKREHWEDENGEMGFRDTPVNIPKGATVLTFGHHEDLGVYDAIIFSDYLPFLRSTSGNFYNIYPKVGVIDDFVKILGEIFSVNQ